MQIVQFKVEDNYLNIVLTLLNNLKLNIIKDLSILRDGYDKNKNLKFNKNDTLTKFMAIGESINHNNKAQEFLKLGGSGCWSGDIEVMRSDRIDYGIGR